MKYLVTIAILFAFIFTGCKKYEEGPLISFRTKKARLANEWEYKKAEYNGQDVTDALEGWTFEIQKDGDYRMKDSDGNIVDHGEWDWEDSKESVEFESEKGFDPFEFDIIRLKEDELFVESPINGELHYFEFGE